MIQYEKDETRHAQVLQEINSSPESVDLRHEDTITLKDQDDTSVAATEELIVELDETTEE